MNNCRWESKNKLFLLISLLLFILPACDRNSDTEKKTEPISKGETVRKLPKLLDLGAHKCIPCKKMTPVLEELSKEYKGKFDVEFIDVWKLYPDWIFQLDNIDLAWRTHYIILFIFKFKF